jgi:hypothetical protein
MIAPAEGRRRTRALLGGLLALLLAAAAALALAARDGGPSPRPEGKRPELLLLTSLPLVFGEEFGLSGGGSPTLTALERRYRVTPINTADAASLRGGRLLLMAHPLAQPAEMLVELDKWVRSGGRLLLLADPALDWESKRPFGDPLRPPPSFADTGLLAHWGLSLAAPDDRGPRQMKLGDHHILTGSPGRLAGKCWLGEGQLAARCKLGRGHATIVADADFLNVKGPGALDGPTQHNLDALLAELDRLERR